MPRRIGFRGWSTGIHAGQDTARIPAAHPRSTAAMRQWVRLLPMQPLYTAKFHANLIHRVEIRLHKKFRAHSPQIHVMPRFVDPSIALEGIDYSQFDEIFAIKLALQLQHLAMLRQKLHNHLQEVSTPKKLLDYLLSMEV